MIGSRTRDERTLAHYPELVEFTPSRGPRLRLAGFGLLAVMITAALLLLPPVTLGGFNILAVVGWVGLAFFIPATTYAVVRALLPQIALRLSADGLTDGSSMSAVGFVPWSQISGVGTSEISGSRLVGVYLRDPEAFIAGLGPIRRVAARTNLRMFGAPVWISPMGLPDADDLSGLIDVYRRGWELQHGVPDA
jgi:hypothetical protein